MQSDEQLVSSYLNGEEYPLEVLISKYARHIFNFIYQYVRNFQNSQDLTQDVFVKAWKNLKKFDLNKSFKVWLFQIARNTSIDFLRKKKEIPFSDLENEDGELEFEDSRQNLEDILEKRETREKIKELFETLPAKFKSVLLMYYQAELNFREIAEITGEPVDTIKSRHRRALLTIKARLIE